MKTPTPKPIPMIGDYVIQSFATANRYRPHFSYAHSVGDKVFAICQGHMIMEIAKKCTGLTYMEDDKFPDCKKQFDDLQLSFDSSSHNLHLVLADLANARYNFTWEKKDCNKCQGAGVIECDCCGNDADCQKCDGEGESDTAVDFSQVILRGSEVEFFNRLDNPNYLSMIMNAAVLLGSSEVIVRNGEKKNSATLFTINESVRVMLMPIVSHSDL